MIPNVRAAPSSPPAALAHATHHPPPTTHRPPPTVCHPPPASYRLLSTTRHPLSPAERVPPGVSQVTVVVGCTYVASAVSIVNALYALNYSPLALVVTAALADGPWLIDVQNGWWQGEYVMEPVAWHQSMVSRGAFSQMTSGEFEERFERRYGEAVSYLGASQFAACCALARTPARGLKLCKTPGRPQARPQARWPSRKRPKALCDALTSRSTRVAVAIERAETLETLAVATQLREMHLDEFFASAPCAQGARV